MRLNTSQITGSWRLSGFTIQSKDGSTRPWGANSHGLLIYSPTGHMSVSINRDVPKNSDNDFKNLFDSILFYSGAYQLDGDIIRHQVTEASNPDRIGKEMIRYAKLEGNTITLTTPEESFGKAVLVWERI